jgi:hypothetical protein
VKQDFVASVFFVILKEKEDKINLLTPWSKILRKGGIPE